MRITILGGGNIGTLMAAECARKGHEVTIHTSRPAGWAENIAVYDRDDSFLFSARLAAVTDDLASALASAELVFVTLPAEHFPGLAARLRPYIRTGQYLGFVPGAGGAEFAFRDFMEKGLRLFGLQRVHSIARLRERGRAVAMLGRKPDLQVATLPHDTAQPVAGMLEELFDMPCRELPNYLSLTLTPSNPLVHPARLYELFRDYRGEGYAANVLFYEEWGDLASTLLLDCDTELQNLCARIPLDLSGVRSLRHHYESDTVPAMTRKIRSIAAFRGLTAPMRETAQGWLPDFSSRYFSTDFAFGLKILLDICRLFGQSTPTMEKLWQWYLGVHRPERSFELDLSQEDFLALYGGASV